MRLTHVEIDTTQLRKNLQAIKASLPAGVEASAVVKANAYGHGSIEVAKIAVEEGYESLAVAIPEEAELLRKAGITVPIYILGLTRPEDFDLLAKAQVSPTVCYSTDFDALQASAERWNTVINCAVAVDTGMHRIGIRPEEALPFLEMMDKYPRLRVVMFSTHMANADSAIQAYTLKQLKAFRTMVETIKAARSEEYIFSAANSAGVMAWPDSHFSSTRPGIIIYGLMPSADVENTLGLKPMLSFYSVVTHVQRLAAGDKVGYGCTYTCTKPTTVATVAAGYADGYERALSNRGEVLIRGSRCSVIGRVCMDQIMVAVP